MRIKPGTTVLVFACWLLSLSFAFAGETKTDSLQRALNTATGTTRVDLLNDLFPLIYRNNTAHALKYLDEADALSENLGYAKGRVGVGVNRALGAMKKNDLREAISIARKWLKQAQANGFVEQEYALYNCIEKSYRELNEIDQCLATLKVYLALAEENKNNLQVAKVYNEMGIAAFYKGNLDGAGENFKRSLAFYEKINDVKEINGLTMNIGIVLYRSGKYEESLLYYKKALAAFEKMADTLEIANTLTNIAITEEALGHVKEALATYQRTALLYKKRGDKKAYSGALENLGNHFFAGGDYPAALKYYFSALRIREELKDERRMVLSYINISKVYLKMRDTTRAIESAENALKITKGSGNLLDEATALGQLTELCIGKKMYEKAGENIRRSIEISRQTGTVPVMAGAYQAYGRLYEANNQLDSALHYYLLSLQLHTQVKQADAIGTLNSSIGNIFLQKGEYRQAVTYLLKADGQLKALGVRYQLGNNHLALAQAYAGLHQYREAYTFYNLYHREWDSLFNVNMSTSMAEMQAKYEVDKKQKENEILRQKSKLDKAELQRKEEARKKQWVIIYAILGVVALCVLLLVVVARTSAQRRKTNQRLAEQNQEISLQKHIIEEKNKDITDSINYARRIQEAILPPDHIIKKFLPHSFVVYKPKDIVSGDFYWIDLHAGKVFFAVVDCTGHGVPGAFVSIVGHNGLNRAIKEYNLSTPSVILDKLTGLVEETFDAHGSGLKDGMDISLCALDLKHNTLEWAGANNPLWIIKKDKSFIEIKADKQPIGKFIDRKSFTNHVLHLDAGDSIYIFSDGYADQFGGPSGKKFKYSQLKEVLISINHLSMEEQGAVIEKTALSWRGKHEQIDDICVMGVRL